MNTNTSAHSSAYSGTVPSEWDAVPCVQYGFPEDEGPARAPKLKTIFESVPEGANTASPVYLLTPNEYQRQGQFENGYKVSGTTSIGKELQDTCEDDDRVLYPIHIESDEYLKAGPETLIEWFREFTEEWLGVPFDKCTFYFSGNRSIHVHVPRLVHGETQRERLKKQAETFCEETEAELDVGLYYAKRMFRLPGVTHSSSTLPKVTIEPEWEHDRIISEATSSSPKLPKSYGEVLREVFVHRGGVTAPTTQSPSKEPHAEIHPSFDLNTAVLELESNERVVSTPLIEDEFPKETPSTVPKWAQYNSKEFSPYAFGAGNPRSIAALRVKDGAFARKDKRNGATMIPAYFYGAVGCNGEFTKEEEHAPLQLSKQDYRKWDMIPGDTIVIIGGQSRSSRIIQIDSWQADVVGHTLTGEGASREDALALLSDEGYDVGSSDTVNSEASRGEKAQNDTKRIWPARSNPETEAERLQLQAEQDGIDTLTHEERGRVACRHLRYGWQPTWEWFKRQYGAAFKPEVTSTNLLNLVDQYEYDVEVPEKLS